MTKKVSIEYCSTHSSHDAEPYHLPLPTEIKHTISVQLHDGVPIDKILDNIRSKELSNGEIGAEQYLKKQTIRNIQRQLNLDCVTKHANDLLSTRLARQWFEL